MSAAGEKTDRRTALKVISGTVAGLIIGGVVGYFAKPAERVVETVVSTVERTVTKTVTETITASPTAPPTTVITTPKPTPTVTPPTPTGYPPGLGPEDEPYLKAAYQLIDWIGGMTVLSPKELEDEILFYVRASKPYRGTELTIMYEAVPGAVWEEKNLGPWVEKIMGFKLKWESMSNYETILKSLEDAKLKAGIYDLLGTDQDMNGYYIYNKSAVNITELLKSKPELMPPHFDVEDFFLRWSYSDTKGNLYALHAYNAFAGTVYRKDWFEDPKNKEEFKKRYGYELKTPLQYYLDARKSGKVEDDWTTDKARDVAEFFTDPDKGIYGYITGVKPGDWLGWYIADGLDDCFQLADPAPEGQMPLDITHIDGISTPWAINVKDWVIGGASTKNGGRLDSEGGQAMYKWWLEDSLKFAPKKAFEIGVVEAHDAFKYDGNYATMWPFYFHWATGLAAEDSVVRGVFEFAPYPCYAPYYHPRKPRGYIDPSGWIISAYSKKIPQAFLFASFMVSKAVELKKNLEVGLPVRWSTVQDPRFRANDEKWGKVITVIELAGKNHFGTDNAIGVVYPEILPLARDKGMEGLGKGMPGAEIAKYVAEAIDDYLKTKGWMGTKVGPL
jgi:glycerol transport system substrate-binding protein